MLGLKLNHVSKRGHWEQNNIWGASWFTARMFVRYHITLEHICLHKFVRVSNIRYKLQQTKWRHCFLLWQLLLRTLPLYPNIKPYETTESKRKNIHILNMNYSNSSPLPSWYNQNVLFEWPVCECIIHIVCGCQSRVLIKSVRIMCEFPISVSATNFCPWKLVEDFCITISVRNSSFLFSIN